MNFFQSQAQAKSQTSRLIAMFAFAVLALIVITNLFIMTLFGFVQLEEQQFTVKYLVNQFNWHTFMIIAAVVSSVVVIGSSYKISMLSGGGQVVAKSLGGTLVTHHSDDYKHTVLLNVVEEIAIASGTPVPQVYILKNEAGINAFAAGFTIDDAVIGITQGAVDYFTREELQGVIAHEFSHIVHGDMRLNMRLIGVLHGILLIGHIGYHILDGSHSGRRIRNGNLQICVLGFGLIAIGYGGTFFGNMIKASISRQREYLADASAVQYTRNNQGIASALKKIGGYSQGSCLNTGEAPSMSHAFFSNGIQSKLMSVFATHPPLAKRIKSIEPSWRGSFPKVTHAMKAGLSEEAVFASPQEDDLTFGLVSSVGTLNSINLEKAKQSLTSIPSSIRQNIYSVDGASAVIYGLLLSKSTDMTPLNKQLDYLTDNASPLLIEKLYLMMHSLKILNVSLRLPLIEIALPQLRQMTQSDYQTFMSNVKWLIKSDERVDIFEWSLERIVSHYLDTEFNLADCKMIKFNSLKAVQKELEIVMSVLCQNFVESDDQLNVIISAKNMIELPNINVQPDSLLSIDDFAKAVDKLALLKPILKEKVIALSYFLVTQDNDCSIKEQETIRALADSLGCPIPIY